MYCKLKSYTNPRTNTYPSPIKKSPRGDFFAVGVAAVLSYPTTDNLLDCLKYTRHLIQSLFLCGCR